MCHMSFSRRIDFILQINDEIWSNPEIRFVEYRAHDLLTKVLEDQGFKVTRRYILPTGFRAEFSPENGKFASMGPNICFISEYDALPGVGHACGHNLIAESGIAMALLTKDIMTMHPERYPGKITVIGSPAEEGGGGKIIMIDAFDDVDVAMMLHASNKGILHAETLCSSRIFANYSSARLGDTFHFFNTFDSMGPGSESDAVVAAYNNIVSLRSQIPQQWRIGVVIKEVDDKLGLEITYRTMHGMDMGPFRARIVSCLEAGATATNCQLAWRFTDPYVEMWPNLVLGNIFAGYLHDKGKRASCMGIEEDLERETCAPDWQSSLSADALFTYGLDKGYNTLVSTDMGNVSQKVPAIHPMYYINTPISLHHADFAKQVGSPGQGFLESVCLSLEI
ncbi:peptidase M20 domain-containing protein 2 [Galendromus occidentalis]|uniref:Peptidase M20 domain-containing protein 2 n=1 Tax=Galendromus occidentalis TaxID=34638 RepID=A0AAJ6VYW7_9ACAR|nr:peptidase M20 domain-containing protein 2 [Galendromus occidentalis]